jgi:hypothetical protein
LRELLNSKLLGVLRALKREGIVYEGVQCSKRKFDEAKSEASQRSHRISTGAIRHVSAAIVVIGPWKSTGPRF